MGHRMGAAGVACLGLASPAAAECIHDCPSYALAAYIFLGLAVAVGTGLFGAVRLIRGKPLPRGLIALFLVTAVPVAYVLLGDALGWG